MIFLCFIPSLVQAYDLDPDRVADTTFKNDTPLQQIYERHDLNRLLKPADSFPQQYEREIVLKLPMKVATDTEFRTASDTEKALYWWLNPNGMPHESYILNQTSTTPNFNHLVGDLTTNLNFKDYIVWGFDAQANLYIQARQNLKNNVKIIRKYNKHGEYVTTVQEGTTRFNKWKKYVEKVYYNENKPFKGPFDSISEALETNSVSSIFVDSVSNLATGELVVDVIDNRNNMYQYAFNKIGLDRKKQSRFTYNPPSSSDPIVRSFIGKYSSNGNTLTAIELLPAYNSDFRWNHHKSNGFSSQYIKIINNRVFYVVGWTYMLPQVDLYIFKYTLKNE